MQIGLNKKDLKKSKITIIEFCYKLAAIVMHGIIQLNTSLFFHSMMIHFSYEHYPLQIVKRTKNNNK